MKSILEFAARHVEPSLKKSLILKLLARNMDRSHIAKCLNVSPSLITRYAKGERGLHDIAAISEVNSILEDLADKIVNEEICGAEVYAEIVKLTIYVLYKKYACGIHYLATRDVNPSTCNICPLIFRNIVST
ncbi:MAG: XRE family transcriptional regulator [Desulfurococcaceae archaeon]